MNKIIKRFLSLLCIFNKEFVCEEGVVGWGGSNTKPKPNSNMNRKNRKKKIKINYIASLQPDLFELPIKTQSIQMDNDETYYVLTQHIRNLQTLTDEEIIFVKKQLSNENLIEIILLYNNNSSFMNDFLMKL